MSQRRSAAKTSEGGASSKTIVVEEAPTSANLKTAAPSPKALMDTALSLEEEEETVPLTTAKAEDDDDDDDDDDDYKAQLHKNRVKRWKESPFAVGLTKVTWSEERVHERYSSPAATRLLQDETGCLCCSALICPLLRADRVGNMVVLKSSNEWVEEVVEDEETGEQTVRRFTRPRLDIVMGPYWPMLCFVTYPLILGVSAWAFWSGILSGNLPIVAVFVWIVFTVSLIVALALTACRDPGILYRTRTQPDGSWRWSDQADSYRPRHAWFDTDTGVVVEGFDHTCPWTGTAIGKKNMLSFQFFVCLVFLCMIMDIFILTGVFGGR